jgi:Wadjet anti plasmid transformation system JetA-like protein
VTSLPERLLRRLEAGRRTRVPLEALQELVLELEPALRASPLKRDRLAEALEEGRRAGRLRLPAQQRLYAGRPPLPAWVVVVRDGQDPPPTVSGRDTFWRQELAWASDLRFSHVELERMRRINAWLRDRADDEPEVPARERSLELFGDEKLLEQLQGGRLFGEDRLSLGLLRARRVHPPFVLHRISSAPVLLVIENHHTYDSFTRLLDAGSGVGIVAYGAGNAFTATVTYASDLGRPFRQIAYFGDVDARGLRIPADASRVGAAAGLPEIRPAVRLYERLLRVGIRAPASPVTAETAGQLAAWLPATLRPEVEAMLVRGERMAQEAVGSNALRSLLAEARRIIEVSHP